MANATWLGPVPGITVMRAMTDAETGTVTNTVVTNTVVIITGNLTTSITMMSTNRE